MAWVWYCPCPRNTGRRVLATSPLLKSYPRLAQSNQTDLEKRHSTPHGLLTFSFQLTCFAPATSWARRKGPMYNPQLTCTDVQVSCKKPLLYWSRKRRERCPPCLRQNSAQRTADLT